MPTTFKEAVEAYDDFKWEDIQNYLDNTYRSRWAGFSAYNQKRVNNKWIFEVPERLSEGDKKVLRDLRNKKARKTDE